MNLQDVMTKTKSRKVSRNEAIAVLYFRQESCSPPDDAIFFGYCLLAVMYLYIGERDAGMRIKTPFPNLAAVSQ
jgi:hypothetical protein